MTAAVQVVPVIRVVQAGVEDQAKEEAVLTTKAKIMDATLQEEILREFLRALSYSSPTSIQK